MEVLSPPPMSHTSSSYSNTPRPSKPPSLLDRRKSATKVVSLPDSTRTVPASSSSPVAGPSTVRLVTDSSMLVSRPMATAAPLRAPRAPSSVLLPFIPLTPIIASPRMTPDLGTTSEAFAAVGTAGTTSAPACAMRAAQYPVGDYLNRGQPSTASVTAGPSLPPPPSWMSTPPTPPGERSFSLPPPPSLVDQPALPEHMPARGRAAHTRPASVAVFPAYRQPSSLSTHLYDNAVGEPANRPGPSSGIHSPPRASSSVPRSFSHHDLRADTSVKRRKTLPKHFMQVVSCSAAHSEDSQHDQHRVMGDEGREGDGSLLPSLSRTTKHRADMGSAAIRRDESTSSSRARRMFTLGDGDGDISDNDGEGSGEGSSKAHTPSDEHEPPGYPVENVPGGSRKYHALVELLTTEVGYLLDLRALVSIYLDQLASLSVPIPTPLLTRPSPSALSISSLALSRPFPSSRSSFLHSGTSSCSGHGPGPPDIGPTSGPPERHREAFEREREPEKLKPPRRPLFAEHELRTVVRNVENLLSWHERFIKILEHALMPLGFAWIFDQVSEDVVIETRASFEGFAMLKADEAASVVVGIIEQEASSFQIYEDFCPGHNEAVDLVRNIQDHYPVEWDAYEQRCSLLTAHAFELASNQLRQRGTLATSSSAQSTDSMRRRRHSTPVLSFTVPVSPFGPSSFAPTQMNLVAQRSEPGRTHKRKGSADIPSSSSTSGQVGRLKLLDYLIKPVQRICKYPLLLDQLKSKGVVTKETDVDGACMAMREVVAKVDQASEQRAHVRRSALITSRLLSHAPVSPTSPDGMGERPAQLHPDFLYSLGACMIAGALDVVYHQSGGGVRTKYLASFLYAGGYLILAKVPKSGKSYDPRHWLCLAGFDIVDEQEDDPSLPYAFHLCGPGVHLHFAAACEQEKMIWISAIQDACAGPTSPWLNAPVSSVPPDARPLIYDEPLSDWNAALPTIQSMSELETPGDATASSPPLAAPRRMPKTVSRADSAIIRQEYSSSNLSALNRRSSTASVKAFFSPLNFDSRVSRPSTQIRLQVDNGLHDVVSNVFVSARSQVRMQDEELFQTRKRVANVSRSNSGLSITGALTRKRYESAAFGASRRKGSLDCVPDFSGDAETVGKSKGLVLSSRSKSYGGKRRSRQPLSVVSQDREAPMLPLTEGPLESPPAMTQCSSAESSNVNSVLPSPLEMTVPLPMPLSADGRKGDYRPKRTRSLVHNVRHFFHSRSLSPTPSPSGSPQIFIASLEETDTPGSLIQWWRRGSLRRRVQSSPEVPMDEPTDPSAPVTPAASSEDTTHSELTSQSSRPASGHSDFAGVTSLMRSASKRVAFSAVPPIRRRSLFVSPTSTQVQNGNTLGRSKTLRTMFRIQRSNSLNPVDLDTS